MLPHEPINWSSSTDRLKPKQQLPQYNSVQACNSAAVLSVWLPYIWASVCIRPSGSPCVWECARLSVYVYLSTSWICWTCYNAEVSKKALEALSHNGLQGAWNRPQRVWCLPDRDWETERDWELERQTDRQSERVGQWTADYDSSLVLDLVLLSPAQFCLEAICGGKMIGPFQTRALCCISLCNHSGLLET